MYKRILFVLLVTTASIVLVFGGEAQAAQTASIVITGRLLDGQDQPIKGAEVQLTPKLEATNTESIPISESLDTGQFILQVNEILSPPLTIRVNRDHFEPLIMDLTNDQLALVESGFSLDVGDLVMTRKVTPGFWAAGLIFIGILLFIAFERLHNTSAALAGASMVYIMHYVVGEFNPDWRIMGFDRSMEYVNWEVIFLVMAMMIVVAIIERTGIFQWTAFQAYRLSQGRTSFLVIILMVITAVASALLDNFTTMLLMTPISLQIGLALGINPLALIIPEILASNVGGISTLIGTPTNILIGAYAGIGFSDFLANQTVGVVVAMIAMGGYVLWHYRAEWKKHSGGISKTLYERLEKNARLKNPDALWKSGIVFILILVGFVVGENYHIVPAVPALVGATILMVWLKPDVHSTIHAVDWTTLVFFIGLFIVVGAVQEVGMVAFAADWMLKLINSNLELGIFVIVFGVGTLSVAIANIPLAASMLPIVQFLTNSIPGAESKVLFYALSMGSAMGGNGFLIGAEANLVTAGITQQAGQKISFKEFMKIGVPVTYITLTIGYIWLLIRF